MHPEFSKIYGEILNRYRRHEIRYSVLGDYELISLMENLVDQAIDEIEMTEYLRPDAKLFLLANLHLIVALPLSFPTSPTKFTLEIQEDIKKDIKVVLNASRQELKKIDSTRKDIAASHILWGTAKVLDNLTLKSWRIWEKKDQ